MKNASEWVKTKESISAKVIDVGLDKEREDSIANDAVESFKKLFDCGSPVMIDMPKLMN